MIKVLVAFTGMILLSGAVYGQQNTFLYTCDENGVFPSINGDVSGFVINQDGTLTELSGSPFPSGGETFDGQVGQAHIVIVGDHLYSSNSAGASIAAFSIDPATGNLTPISGTPFRIGVITNGSGLSLAATPNGRYLFAGSPFAHVILTFAIEADGSLTGPIQTLHTTLIDTQMVVSPNGKFLAVGGAQLAVFKIKQSGSLKLVDQQSLLSTLDIVDSINFNCNGDMIFASGEASPLPPQTAVQSFKIKSTGKLKPVSSFSTVTGFGQWLGCTLYSPALGRLFASDRSDNRSIAQLDISPDGALSLAAGSPISAFDEADDNPNSVPAAMALNQSGTELFVQLTPNMIAAFMIGSSGAFTPVSGSPFQARGSGIALGSMVIYPQVVCSSH